MGTLLTTTPEGVQILYRRRASTLILKGLSPDNSINFDLLTLDNIRELDNIRPESLLIIGIHAIYNTAHEPLLNTYIKHIETRGTGYVSFECFKDSHNLKTVKHGEGLKVLEDDVYNNCALLESVELPKTVTRLGERVFYHCRNLKRLTLPTTCPIKAINSKTFAYIGSTGAFYIPDDVCVIGNNALHHAPIQSIKGMESVVSIGDYFGSVTDIVKFDYTGDYLQTIGFAAFNECSKLKSVRINAPIESIGALFCSESDNVTSIVIESQCNIKNFNTIDSEFVLMRYTKGNVMINTRVPSDTVEEIHKLIASKDIEIAIMCPDSDINIASLLILPRLKKLMITAQYIGKFTKKAHT